MKFKKAHSGSDLQGSDYEQHPTRFRPGSRPPDNPKGETEGGRGGAAPGLSGSYAGGHSNRGTALRDADRLQGSASAYEAALRLSPRFPEVQHGMRPSHSTVW